LLTVFWFRLMSAEVAGFRRHFARACWCIMECGGAWQHTRRECAGEEQGDGPLTEEAICKGVAWRESSTRRHKEPTDSFAATFFAGSIARRSDIAANWSTDLASLPPSTPPPTHTTPPPPPPPPPPSTPSPPPWSPASFHVPSRRGEHAASLSARGIAGELSQNASSEPDAGSPDGCFRSSPELATLLLGLAADLLFFVAESLPTEASGRLLPLPDVAPSPFSTSIFAMAVAGMAASGSFLHVPPFPLGKICRRAGHVKLRTERRLCA